MSLTLKTCNWLLIRKLDFYCFVIDQWDSRTGMRIALRFVILDLGNLLAHFFCQRFGIFHDDKKFWNLIGLDNQTYSVLNESVVLPIRKKRLVRKFCDNAPSKLIGSEKIAVGSSKVAQDPMFELFGLVLTEKLSAQSLRDLNMKHDLCQSWSMVYLLPVGNDLWGRGGLSFYP